MKKAKNKPQQLSRKTPQPSLTKSASNLFSKSTKFARWLVALAVVCLLGFVHWPVFSRDVTGGIGVWADCNNLPSVSLSGVFSDISSYEVNLSISGADAVNCRSMRIASPASTIYIAKMIDISKLSEGDAERIIASGSSADEKMPLLGVRDDGLQQYFDVDLSKNLDKNLNISLVIKDVSAESFSRFKILIGSPLNKNIGPGRYMPTMIDSIAIGPRYTLVNAAPEPSSHNRQLGSDILYFGRADLSELLIEVDDKWRTWFQNIFDLVCAGAALSFAAIVFAPMLRKREK